MAGAFVTIAARRLKERRRLLGPANLLTLCRAAAAALLGATAFSGRGAGVAWAGLLLGCTASDWLDGPLARRTGGGGPLGAVLDLEADSWLTLWAAVAATRLGRLPPPALVAPAARYPLLLMRIESRPIRGWQRAAGVVQMAVLIAALAPWPALGRPARAAAPVAGFAQLAALAADVLRRR